MPQAQTSTPTPTQTSANSLGDALHVTPYERVASLLISLLVLVGVAVAGLLIIWFTGTMYTTQAAVPVLMEDLSGGREDGVVGESMQLDSELDEIAQETEFEEPELQETLELMTDTVATQLAQLDNPALADEVEAGGGGRSTGTGQQVGFGSGEGESGLPRAERWVIQFRDNALDEYARQLDFFGIELATIGPEGVQYASGLAGQPKRRTGRGGDDEQRLYMSWQDGTLKDFDSKLLLKAGIPTVGKLMLQFYSPETENLLANLEKNYANRDAKEIRKTVFEVQPTPGGFEFKVTEQSYF